MNKRTEIQDISEQEKGQEELSDEQLELVVGGLPVCTAPNTCSESGDDDC